MDVTWIYQHYGALIHAELLGSGRLKENGLESIVAGMAPLCYGGSHGQCVKLTATLYHSLTAGQRKFTTWYTKYCADCSQQFYFGHALAWIHCPGNIGLHFLMAACSSDATYGLLFATMV